MRLKYIAFKNAQLPTQKIDFVIVHHDGKGECMAFTISFPNQTSLKEIYSKIQWLEEAKQIVNRDSTVEMSEPEKDIFHFQLHKDMMEVLHCDFPSSLTDYHQHWVSNHGQCNSLRADDLGSILTALFRGRYIAKEQYQMIVADIGAPNASDPLGKSSKISENCGYKPRSTGVATLRLRGG